MRNAAATFDDDLGFDPPARKKATRKPGSPASGKKKKKGKILRFDRLARYAAIGMSATVVVGILVNALVLQKGRHPAPLFVDATALKEAPSAAAAVTARDEAPPPAVPVTPVTTARTDVAAARPPSASAAGKGPRAAAAVSETAALGDDAIGRLLKTGSAAGPQGSSAEKVDPKTVFNAQKALSKLGFAVKPTGTTGPATRKAIEAFEKDRHLPVKGELSHRVLKTLATESGIRID